MKYIHKVEVPQFFIDDIKDLRENIKTVTDKAKIWNDDYKNKRVLKEHLLVKEQNYLCGYCEAKVTLDNSHIEHIQPKSLDYDNLTFDYTNLLVSCDGICFSEENKPITCGHKKGSRFDKEKFLNPTEKVNIRDYFVYTDNYYIGASSLDEEKSKYTMSLLQLNTFNNYLPEARKKALEEFQNSVKEYTNKTGKDIKETAKFLLNKENLAFISFLRFRYKALL